MVERFRDELGDWRVCVLSTLGSAVLTPLSLLLRHDLRLRYGAEPQVMCTNDGIVLRIPDTDAQPPGPEIVTGIDLATVHETVEREVGASALFSARFRECAARALLLPRRNPGRRNPGDRRDHAAGRPGHCLPPHCGCAASEAGARSAAG